MNDDLVTRLAAIQDAILALPDDAFAEKFELLKERDKLRDEAADYSHEMDKGRSDGELLNELAALRAQLKVLEGLQIDAVGQSAGGAGGASIGLGSDAVALNQKIMDAGGAGSIRSRIGIIKGHLEDREVDVPKES